MKWLIASDLPGSLRYCRELLQAFSRERAERLLLLGDLLYHGPRNDLPDQYAPKEVIPLLNERKEEILCVRGNCDAEVDQMVLDFPLMVDYALVCTPECRMYDVLLFGHTHVPCWEKRNGVLCLNPGSVSIPKNHSPRGYISFSEGVFEWKTLDGEAYHSERV